MEAHDLAAALDVLLASSYATCFEWTSLRPDALPSMRKIEHMLRASAIQSISGILRFLHGAPGGFIVGFLHRYELLNIKKTLRRLSQPERREHHLEIENYNLGRYALVPNIDWDKIADTQQLGQTLEPTYYRYAYRKGQAVFSESHDLLVFESALEKAYHDELAERAERLDCVAQAAVGEFLANYMDEVCLASFVRLKFEQNMEAPAILPLLSLRACDRVTEKLLWRLADAPDEDECVALLREERGWAQMAGNTLRETVHNLRKERQVMCRQVFRRASPLSLAPALAYYFLREQEVAEIIALLQTKRFRIQPRSEAYVLATAAAA